MQASRNPINQRPRFSPSGILGRQIGSDAFVIMANGNGTVAYEFVADGPVEKIMIDDVTEEREHVAAEWGNDTIIDNGDGTYTVQGETANWHGDAYHVNGTIIDFTVTSRSAPISILDGGTDVTHDYLGDPPVASCQGDDECPQDSICIDGQCVIERETETTTGITREQAGLGALALAGAGYFFY